MGMSGRSVPPLKIMTTGCTYYRIANEEYKHIIGDEGVGGRIYEDLQDILEELRDVAFCKRMKFVDVEDLYDIDSPADSMRFTTEHYGEL